MTQAFLIIGRILLTILVGYWAYRLSTRTASRTSRVVGILLSAAIVWQIIAGTL